jgi:serine/threonine protein kinase
MAKTGKYFNFKEGEVLLNKYKVLSLLGSGWEAEVYHVEEMATGIGRAIKVFYPKRNINNKVLNTYAKKLHRLKDCSLLIHYLTQEKIEIEGETVFFMVSDFVQSQTLQDFIKKQPKGFISQFEALHIINELAKGLEVIHLNKDYHGDLHSSNVLINRKGLGFDIKILDFHTQPGYKKDLIKDDTVDLIGVLYEMLGGVKRYKNLSPELKEIILGRKKTLILKKFPKVSDLRFYLENMTWTR